MINQQEVAFGILLKWNTAAQNLRIEYNNHLDLVHSTMHQKLHKIVGNGIIAFREFV